MTNQKESNKKAYLTTPVRFALCFLSFIAPLFFEAQPSPPQSIDDHKKHAKQSMLSISTLSAPQNYWNVHRFAWASHPGYTASLPASCAPASVGSTQTQRAPPFSSCTAVVDESGEKKGNAV